LKATFQKFVDNKVIPNLLLAGKSGMGKTTIARAMCEELGCDYILINGSMRGNIDTLRNDILTFASSVSLSGGRKYVILDEADYLNANSFQPALRGFIEEFSKNCGFILTCNFPSRIIEHIHSRCSVITFSIPKADRPKIAAEFYNELQKILKAEQVPVDGDALAALVQKHFPDFRRVLGELQRYSSSGRIDKGIMSDLDAESVKKLFEYMKKKEFSNVRKWVGEQDADTTTLFRRIYDGASVLFTASSIPPLILILAKYQYQAAFVADQEVNTVAALAEIMGECEFK
jgi:DNA polymerase III delta prime subunit